MKTKNILIPAFAIAMFAAPVIAQQVDYHDMELMKQDTAKVIQNAVKKSIPQKNYLDTAYLIEYMNHDLSIDLNKLFKSANNSIKDKKVTDEKQYELMALAIKTNHNEVLATLILAGFDKNIDMKLNQEVRSLAAEAVITNNQEAFQMVFNKERVHNVVDELKNDMKLLGRLTDFIMNPKPVNINLTEKANQTQEEDIIGAAYHDKNGTLVIKNFDKPLTEKEYQKWLQEEEMMKVEKIGHNFSGGAHVSEPLVKEPFIVKNEYGEQIGSIYSDPRTNITVIDYSGNALEAPKHSKSEIRMAPAKANKGYEVDTVPAATATIKVISDTVTEEQYQQWLNEEEMMKITNPRTKILKKLNKNNN